MEQQRDFRIRALECGDNVRQHITRLRMRRGNDELTLSSMFAVKSLGERDRAGDDGVIVELPAAGGGPKTTVDKLSYAGWISHDRGFVLGLPGLEDEHRQGRRMTGREVPQPRSACNGRHLQLCSAHAITCCGSCVCRAIAPR
jgi:hypothetical protein